MRAIVTGGAADKDGRLKVPTGPGLGLVLDEVKLQAMRIRE